MKKFEGVYTALVTPFNENGKIDTKIIQKLVDNNISKGVAGFYVAGSTGESYLLSPGERKYLLEAVTEAVGNRAEVIVNIGMFATEHSVDLAWHAQKQGVSAISSVPPFYFPFSIEEYVRYYNDLTSVVNTPVILYNIPEMSSVKFSTKDINRILKNEKIIGLKHTSYDLFQMQRVIEENPNKSVFIGHDEIFLPAYAMGARASIGSTNNFMAEKFVEIERLFKEGEMDAALKVQNQANEVIEVLCEIGVFKGVKAALKMQGIDCGICREPFQPLGDEEERKLEKVLCKNGCI